MNHEELHIAKTESLFREVNETRADGARFLVASGHEKPEYEDVVRSRPGYRIVAKLRAIGAAARRLDPRSDPA